MKQFQLFSIKYDSYLWACHIQSLIYWDMLLSIPILLECFFINVQFSQRLFLHLYRWPYDFFLHFVSILYYIDCFDIEQFLYSWNKSHWIVVYDPFNVLLIFSWRFLHVFFRDVGLQFICSVLVWFWHQGNSGHVKWFWECSFLFSFWMRKISITSSLNVW